MFSSNCVTAFAPMPIGGTRSAVRQNETGGELFMTTVYRPQPQPQVASAAIS